ncbi:MAG: cytidine deaminase [Alloprevotella sp.]|nr:cytidine deaminase [Alloprevotella sp.]
MKNGEVNIRYRILDEQELNEADHELVEAAKAATHTSFSPYSHFSVGAALRLANGETLQGSNQENAAYTTGICAERCTIFYANAHYPDSPVTAMAIAARQADGAFTPTPVSPCGACRQVLSEAEHRFGQAFRVLLYGGGKVYEFASAADLLPFQFTADSL